jgi:hypothetical protein
LNNIQVTAPDEKGGGMNIKDYITFCKDMDGNYTVLRSSEQLKEVYSEKTKYTKKQWLEDLSHNGLNFNKMLILCQLYRKEKI